MPFADSLRSFNTLSNAQAFILPVGVLMGVFHLNMNIELGRSTDLLANGFLCIGAVLSYALSGWITGAAIALALTSWRKRLGE